MRRLPLTLPTRLLILFILQSLLIVATPIHAIEKADIVTVYKSERILFLMREGEVLAKFNVTFGAEPIGHKQQQGDEKTPEGPYILDYKNAKSAFYRSIHVSYPNAKDRTTAQKLGVDPGGDIMIHGQTNDWGWAAPISRFFNWTDGCIALSNEDMQQVWESVDSGTPIEIHP